MKHGYWFVILLVFICSCKKSKPTVILSSKGVYITNEGNFNFGNGEISFYNPNTNAVSDNVFHSVNGYSPGDVVQSMYIKDSIGFIVVNNSQKIEVVKISSLQSIRTINLPGSSPRYILPIDDSIAYVSELYSNKIHVINYATGNLVTEISVPQYTEHLVILDEYVFAEGKKIYSNPSAKGALMRIRTIDHTYIDEVEFAGDAQGISVDLGNHVWILTGEDSATLNTAAFHVFDKNLNHYYTYSFSTMGIHPNNFVMNPNDETIWFVSGKDIYKCDNFSFPGFPVIHSTASNIYATGIDPNNGDIYASDALDYVQQSKIFRYDKNGTFIHSFNAGVISGNFAFSK